MPGRPDSSRTQINPDQERAIIYSILFVRG